MFEYAKYRVGETVYFYEYGDVFGCESFLPKRKDGIIVNRFFRSPAQYLYEVEFSPMHRITVAEDKINIK